MIIQDFVDRHSDRIKATGRGRTDEKGAFHCLTRDIRLTMSEGCNDEPPLHIDRIALNMDQVELYEPPPNPAKLTDSRSTAYIDEFGDESWELDVLEPSAMVELIRERIEENQDEELWEQACADEAKGAPGAHQGI